MIFEEYAGTNMSIQVPLLVIDQEMCLGHVYIVLEPVGSAHLRFRWQLYYVFVSFDVPKEFGVPDKIGDMTRSLEMVET